ncbi:hypothetical protein E2C01_061557 [Portunus trituberculatus]|uniref:Uncharacterized protein n=1 Tax=Portunus trituberculatus TaxID=210409 RepID=A0A5B7H8G9_PORTR|nr:hypothetical protein [Portunus trituberculatus]
MVRRVARLAGRLTVVVGLCLVVDLVVVRCGGVAVPSNLRGKHNPKVERLRNNKTVPPPCKCCPSPVCASVPRETNPSFTHFYGKIAQPRDSSVNAGLWSDPRDITWCGYRGVTHVDIADVCG